MKKDCFVYVGNWNVPTPPAPGGVSVFRFSAEDGTLQPLGQCAEKTNVGAMALDAANRVLYVTDERTGSFGAPGGSLLSFAIDPQSGQATPADCAPSLGVYPSNIALVPDGEHLLLTNLSGFASVCRARQEADGSWQVSAEYDESSLVLFGHTPEGHIEKAVDLIAYPEQGNSPLQRHAMAHSVTASPSGKLFLVCDKGADLIRLYRIDKKLQKLVLCSKACAPEPGSGPRYAVFHTALPVFYHNNELLARMCVYGYSEDGQMHHLQTVDMLPEGMVVPPELGLRERPAPSDLVLGPDGTHLYAALRILDQLLVFVVDAASGILTLKQRLSCGGKNPRGLAVDPTGKYLLAANLDSKAVAVFSIAKDGRLTDTGKRAPAPNPGSLVFSKME